MKGTVPSETGEKRPPGRGGLRFYVEQGGVDAKVFS